MAGQFDRFWNSVPGMLPGAVELGIGAYGAFGGGKEANRKVDAAQGPLYQAATTQAQNFLGRSTDPRRQAQQRLDAELDLLREDDEMNLTSLQGRLLKQGMLDSALSGGPGQAAYNPHMAAYFRERDRRNAKMASDALDKGEAAVTNNINRAGALNTQAANAQNTGLIAQRARGSNTARNLEFLKTGAKVLKDTGMLGMAGDWLKRTIGGITSPWDNYDFSVGDNSFFGF